MKPSNTGFSDPSIKTGTGINWLVQGLSGSALGALVSLRLPARDRAIVCEWAAQIAIAEYRKELAEKVESVPRFAPIMKDGPVFSHYAMMDEYSGGGWVKLSDMRSLLNENDHAE